MNHLIVYAHPRKDSMNHAILDTVKDTLEGKGSFVRVRNLYDMKWNPVLSEKDLKDIADGKLPKDIKEEQQYVAEADQITLIYPIWWAGMPAILKGWIDRVFAYGFAYSYNADGSVEGLLKGKKGFIINTMGETVPNYDESGMLRSMKQTTDENIFEFTGMTPAGHLFFGGVADLSEKEGRAILDEVRLAVEEKF